jgi:hypothetical protein
VSSIGKGILIFAAIAPGDTEKDVDALAAKVVKMRLWDDEAGGRVRSFPFVIHHFYAHSSSFAGPSSTVDIHDGAASGSNCSEPHSLSQPTGHLHQDADETQWKHSVQDINGEILCGV